MTYSKTKNIRSKAKARKTRKIRGGMKRVRNDVPTSWQIVGNRLGQQVQMINNGYSSGFEKRYRRDPIFRRHIVEANELNRQSVLSMTPSNVRNWEKGETKRQKQKNQYIMNNKAKVSVAIESPNRSPEGRGSVGSSAMSNNYQTRVKSSIATLAEAIPQQKAHLEREAQKKKERIDKIKDEIKDEMAKTEVEITQLQTSIKTMNQPRSIGTLLRSPLSFIKGEHPTEIRMELDRLGHYLKKNQEYLALLKNNITEVERS